MDPKQFIQALSSEQRKRITRKSDAKGALAFTVHFVALAITTTCIVLEIPSPKVSLLWILPHGILLVFLFTPLHECIHNTAFATPGLNTWAARLCGWLILTPNEWFRQFHFAHHRHTNDPQKDPELTFPKPKTRRQYWLHISGIPLWIAAVKTLARNALGYNHDAYIPKDRRHVIQRESAWMLAAYATLVIGSLLTNSTWIVWLWLVPLLIGQPFLRLFLLAEHGGCDKVDNYFQNTRTTFTHSVINRLAWNMPYHAEHHLYPAVPFHRLPEFHELTQPHLQITSPGYQAFHKRYRAENLHD